MNRSLLVSATVLTLALAFAAPKSADAFRGGGFAGGGFHGGDFGGAGGFHGAAVGGGEFHAGGVAAGGAWHAGGGYGGGFHGPAVVNHYYNGGCWNCGAGIAAGVIGAAAAAYAIGSLVASVPPGCPYQDVNGTNYYVCDGTWFQPYYGYNGLYYRVVPPL